MIVDQERQSADALRAYAETLGRWPKVSEWNQYAKEHNLLLYPQISRKLKKNWKALKASFGYDDTLHYIEKSEQALFALAEELGYWPNVAEWDEYAKKHGYCPYRILHVKTRKGWKAYRKEFNQL